MELRGGGRDALGGDLRDEVTELKDYYFDLTREDLNDPSADHVESSLIIP